MTDKNKKYSGYGFHGGGRPRKDDAAKHKTISISGAESEINKLKTLASEKNKTVSRFVFEDLVK